MFTDSTWSLILLIFELTRGGEFTGCHRRFSWTYFRFSFPGHRRPVYKERQELVCLALSLVYQTRLALIIQVANRPRWQPMAPKGGPAKRDIWGALLKSRHMELLLWGGNNIMIIIFLVLEASSAACMPWNQQNRASWWAYLFLGIRVLG